MIINGKENGISHIFLKRRWIIRTVIRRRMVGKGSRIQKKLWMLDVAKGICYRELKRENARQKGMERINNMDLPHIEK